MERDLNEILDVWSHAEHVICTYNEARLLIEFLINNHTPFNVSYVGDKIVIGE